MPEAFKTENDDAALAVPGLLQVTPVSPTKSTVAWGGAAGWFVPRGIQHWERELSFVARSQLTSELARKIRATLPSEQIAPRKYPWAARAVETSPVLPIASNLAADLRKEGVRVHTVGVDRVSSGFYYFAEGGSAEPVQVQGNLVEMLTPSLTASSTNADIAALLEDVVDRLLGAFSGGALNELQAELADALPRLSRDGTGLVGTDLDAFEAQARGLAERSARWESDARRLVDALVAAEKSRGGTTAVPLYREATREAVPPLEVQVGARRVTLPEKTRWVVSGPPTAAAQPQAERRPEAAERHAVRGEASPPSSAVASPRRDAPKETPVAAAAAPNSAANPSAAIASGANSGASAPTKATPLGPIQPVAIAMIGVPGAASAAPPAAEEGSAAAAPSAIAATPRVVLDAPPAPAPVETPPPEPRPVAAAPVPTAELAPAPNEATQPPAAEKPAARKPKAGDKARSTEEPGRPRKAATADRPAPAPRRSFASNMGFIVVLTLGAIGYFVWQWMHHHGVHFHLPMR